MSPSSCYVHESQRKLAGRTGGGGTASREDYDEKNIKLYKI